MSSLFTTLGLRTAPPGTPIPSLASTFLIYNFVYAHALLSTRGVKNHLNLDHNSCPREDVTKYGEKMVKEGKITSKQLAMLKRWEAAHANSVEGYTVFVAGVLLALHAGVPNQELNYLMTIYSIARLGYGIHYIINETERWSWVRTVFWWTGNISCGAMVVKGGKRL